MAFGHGFCMFLLLLRLFRLKGWPKSHDFGGLVRQGLALRAAMEGDKQLETIRAVQDDVDNFMHRMKEKLSYLEDARMDV